MRQFYMRKPPLLKRWFSGHRGKEKLYSVRNFALGPTTLTLPTASVAMIV